MKHIIYKIFILSSIFTLFNCGQKSSQQIEMEFEENAMKNENIQVTQAQFEQRKMTLGNLEEKPFPTVVNVNGMIDVPPANRAVVSATMGGYIKTTPWLIGDKVRKGQVLVSIENPEFVAIQQQYMEINEQLTYLKAEYDRQVTMKAENITSQKSFLKAESDYKTAVATHTGLDKQLRMLNISPSKVRDGEICSVVNIHAPVSGSITKMNVTKGAYVSPATEILEIIDNKHIQLELSVYEKDIMKVKKGQHIDFKIPEISSENFKATVFLVGTSIQDNRTIKVHAQIENEAENTFLTGMFVEAAIVTESTSAKALPSESVIEVDGEHYVLVLNKKEGDSYYFSQEKVEVKESYDGYSKIENADSFAENTRFLTKGAFGLLGG
ncbi:efflux RND transporter periplasmic adaptor subunit [Hwangdonia lutea]|uniref:Efflux RND transporter periplasmic adaptor subunit n=1 Tax=Hwangdonia lutea TaxID=3075823 RepID=A0AA97EK76_9FLAO|nr:efflux RND transporter periplasmic adaptor subunit [Hwangdonia sp. SCSIO 19198]WOD42971.1 efflux RND transporter periplasmic adaptor subunit [Hwangdonia sp. SCSIO 19198]